ncbi:MAG: M20/M25/M40 family metallo-hydrolase, partial [Methylotenera sp.]|nr:M20/M25/M40 family metallo-hydrolase [Oligoflexia bacterium]
AFKSYREAPHSRRARAFSAPLEATSTIDTRYLIDSLTVLSGEKDPVLANRGKKTGRTAARQFLKEEFESFGFTVSEQNYGSGSNLIAERVGTSGKILVVSAHYDSVNNAGADDDGTGVVAMLATAKLLKGKDLKHTVRFVAFDEEELGLVGSSAYAKSLVKNGEKAKILGDFEMEMMGYNAKNDGKFHVISCDRADSKFMVDAFKAVVTRLGTGLEITSACTDRSDHAAFWKNGMPAIVLSENFFGGDANPCYHKACDKMDRMNLSYFERVAEASANVVVSLVTE